MSFPFDLLRSFFCSVLQLISFGPKSSNTLRVYIKTNTGKMFSVNLEPNADIKYVKKLVAYKMGIAPNCVRIIFAGKELIDSTTIEECDLGQKSMLHAVQIRTEKKREQELYAKTKKELSISQKDPSKPLCETLMDLQLENEERTNINEEDRQRSKAHFFVHCSQCKRLCKGKLRVRCSICKEGALTVLRDPVCWNDVLQSQRIQCFCENCKDSTSDIPAFAEFYFKCSEHMSGTESDFAVPLHHIKLNTKDVPCLACTDIKETILVFFCESKHVICIDCFRQYCRLRLSERQFVQHSVFGYTLPCPIGCERSFIEETHHFKLLSCEEYERYKRYAAEEYVLQAGGILCPHPGCGMGLLFDKNCKKLICQNGCGYVFCRYCLQGYHLGECLPERSKASAFISSEHAIDSKYAAEARWDEASKIAIKILTKPCPKCRTPTERDGGCMHMLCTRAGCGFEWCWVCQTYWTRDCMGAHWFG